MDRSDPCRQGFDSGCLETLRPFYHLLTFTGGLIIVKTSKNKHSVPVFFFSSTVTAGTTFWFLNCHIFECKSTPILQIYRKTPFRSEKHPCGAFGPTIRESKNFSSCFSLLSCCVQRAQRAEKFVFSLGFFFWNGLRTKLEALEISEISQLSLFWGGCAEYTRKKNTDPKQCFFFRQPAHFGDPHFAV